MQNANEITGQLEQEDTIDIKELFFMLLSKWYWFALFGFLGVSGGYLITRHSQPTYLTESTVIVSKESNNIMEEALTGLNFGKKTEIENDILIMGSYTLNRQAIENLNWQVSWFREELFNSTGIYGDYPYIVEKTEGASNVTGVEIYITPYPDNSYRVNVDGEFTIKGVKRELVLEKNGEFGAPFKSEFLNFTLTESDGFNPGSDNRYYFVFNDVNRMALAYQKKVKISPTSKGADSFKLSIEGSNPNREADYLNKLTEVYLNYGLNKKNQAFKNTVDFIDVQLEGILDTLKVASRNFIDFRSKNGIVDMGQEAILVLESLETLETEHSISEMRLEYYTNLRNYLTNGNQMKQAIAPSVIGIADAALNMQVVKLGELYGKRDVLSYSVQESNPTLLLLDREIESTKRLLRENINNLVNNGETETRSLKRRIDKLNDQLVGLPQTEQELINIKRSVDLNDQLYTFLLQKRAESAIAMASNVPDAHILDPATINTSVQTGPRTLINLVMGLLLGLAIPFLGIFISDFFNDTINSKEQIDKATKLPILASIFHRPYMKELVVTEHPRSAISESYRRLRTNMKFLVPKKGAKIISIHSTIPGEGKTVTSTNIAAIIAMNNMSVLLVGCDLRKPRLHKIFEVENTIGMSSYLIEANSFDEVVCPTKVKNLSLAVGGPIPPNPGELLENGELGQFFEEAKKRFDYIIVDNAPVSLVSDAFATALHADVNLFMLREAHSHRDQIRYINQLSEKGTIKNIALVYNDTRQETFGYGNRYSYKKYKNSYVYAGEDKAIKKKWRAIGSMFS